MLYVPLTIMLLVRNAASLCLWLAGWLSVRTFVGRNRMNAGTIVVYCKQALSRKRVSQATIKDLYYEC